MGVLGRTMLLGALLALGFMALVDGAKAAMTPKEAAELLDKSVVEMTRAGAQTCTASKIGPATFLTAAHCVHSLGDNFRIDNKIGYQFVRSVTVALETKADRKRHEDWAILHATTVNNDVPALELGCQEDIYPGMPIAYGGYPGPLERVFATGYITSVKKSRGNRNSADFMVDLAAAPGASGSPIISMDTGKVIGVLTEGVAAERIGFFMIGVESIRSLDICEDMIAEKTGNHPHADEYESLTGPF